MNLGKKFKLVIIKFGYPVVKIEASSQENQCSLSIRGMTVRIDLFFREQK